MLDGTNQELRRIRITLIVIAIIILFGAGSKTVTVDHDPNYWNSNLINSNMVELGDGYFGVLASDQDGVYQYMKVYYFDKEKKEVIFIDERDLSVME
ncbi:hypothetical protein R4Z10_07405 [Niallia sp. XMNu-256]|uniref:hypothetical protein n=1 Tax=Niallia sp. XMNu-256 TaxID=3082444 RepID=UPI0030D2CEB0